MGKQLVAQWVSAAEAHLLHTGDCFPNQGLISRKRWDALDPSASWQRCFCSDQHSKASVIQEVSGVLLQQLLNKGD